VITEQPRFGRYEILEREEIDGGGFDALARGPDRREVRLWVGGAGSASPAAGRQDLDRVREALVKVYQAGLPRVLGAEVVDGRAVLVVQAYHGRSLARALESGALDELDAIDRVRGIAAALVKAHRAGLTHGNINPAEILLADDGRTLLLHLGLGPYLGADDGATAPASEAGDVFALAGVLNRCLVGPAAAPHPGEENLPARWPQGLRRLLARALHADPARRMRRAEELAGDLAVIRASWGAPSARASRPGRLRLSGPLGFALAGVAALALALRLRSC
jgi:hypothetical protein